MGTEFGQWDEWDHDSELDWQLLEYSEHSGLAALTGDLNRLIARRLDFYSSDCDPQGFRWIDFNDTDATVVSFIRYSRSGSYTVCVFNMTPVARQDYCIGVPEEGTYTEILNTDAEIYGGSGVGNLGKVQSRPFGMHGLPCSLKLNIPPLGALFLGSPGSSE